MKSEDSSPRETNLDQLLKEVLTGSDPSERPSPQVVSAVMAQVRGARLVVRPLPVDVMTLVLVVGGTLAWVAGRLLIRTVPALRSLLGLVGWRFGESVASEVAQHAFGTLRGLVSFDFGSLFPVILLGTIIAFSLGVRRQRRRAEN